MADPVRWAIWATGAIAEKFATDLPLVTDASLVAVGSRTMARADAFADRFGIPGRHEGLPALLSDDSIDVVYVASPASAHHADALAVIAAGRHLLLEKPFTLEPRYAQEIVDAARSAGTFLMEAMWSRFLPYFGLLREHLAAGAIGEINYVEADFGMRVPGDSRLFEPSTGGGALFDLGVYPLQLVHAVLGVPRHLQATASLGPSGVDEITQIALRYPAATAAIRTSITVPLGNEARLVGEKREIVLPKFLHCPQELLIGHRDFTGGELVIDQRVEAPMRGNGLHYEAAAVQSCLRSGAVEHPRMRWSDTLEIMSLLGETARQIDLHVG